MRIGEKAFVLFGLTLLILNIKASSSTDISVNPPAITVNTGQDFTFSVDVENVDDLICYQVRLNWTPSLLNVEEVTEGPFLDTNGYSNNFATFLNNAEGSFFATHHTTADIPEGAGASGSGTLMECAFNSAGSPGGCALELCDTKLFNSSKPLVDTPPYLGDSNGDLMVGWYDLFTVVEIINGHLPYEAGADFNSDGAVDLYDLLCVLYNYGTHYGPGVKAEKPVEIPHQVYSGSVEVTGTVGGVVVAVNKLGLLAPYLGLASTAMIGAVATAVYVKRVKRRKEKQ
jgi:hypothetical protein